VEVWQTPNLRPLRLGEEKKTRKKERRNHMAKIYWSALFHRATIKNTIYTTSFNAGQTSIIHSMQLLLLLLLYWNQHSFSGTSPGQIWPPKANLCALSSFFTLQMPFILNDTTASYFLFSTSSHHTLLPCSQQPQMPWNPFCVSLL